MSVHIYPFDADLSGSFARLPFIFEGKPLNAPFCALSLKAGGSMDINGGAANRRAFFDALGIQSGAVYYASQIHSRELVYIDDIHETPLYTNGADGFVSARADGFLAVTVADCLPVALFDTRRGAFALLHSGWRGTGIAARALRLMAERRGTEARDVAALLGPCICGGCYEVDEARAREFCSRLDAAPERPLGEPVRKTKEGGAARFYIDMKAANAALLAGCGVKHIAYCKQCTYTEERLGSFRREGPDSYTKMLCILGRRDGCLGAR